MMIEMKEFTENVTKEVRAALGMGYSVESHMVPKINGLTYHGLCISQVNSSIAPTIRLEPYYDRYLYEGGRSEAMKEVTDDILKQYRENLNLPSCFTTGIDLKSYGEVKEKVMFKLINADYNKNLLSQVPHLPFLDLSIVFYLALDEDERGQYTALVHSSHQEMWEVGTKALYQQAMENTQRDFPAVIKNMAQIIRELGVCLESGKGGDGDIEPSLYVLSNTCGINGAGTILYEKVLEKFSAEKRCDILMLPSSLHEVLLLPSDGTVDGQELKKLVEQINRTEVPAEDVLSDHVYQYTYRSKKLSIAA